MGLRNCNPYIVPSTVRNYKHARRKIMDHHRPRRHGIHLLIGREATPILEHLLLDSMRVRWYRC